MCFTDLPVAAAGSKKKKMTGQETKSHFLGKHQARSGGLKGAVSNGSVGGLKHESEKLNRAKVPFQSMSIEADTSSEIPNLDDLTEYLKSQKGSR